MESGRKKNAYLRFALMIATSTLAMLMLMYLNTNAWEHVFFSETRVYMAILMGASMAAIMLAFMLAMYPDRRINIGILVGAGLIFLLSLWLVRSQVTVSGTSYMRAMIPHHSIAIMTSERAQIRDPRVRKLADEIIESQRREIAEMRYLIAHAEERGAVYRDPPDEPGNIADALHRARISTLDPAPMPQAQAEQLLQGAGRCRFYLGAESDPVLWASEDASAGAVKLNGVLVRLQRSSAAGGSLFAADGANFTVTPLDGDAAGRRQEADLVFALDGGLTVGYRGSWDCG